MDHSLVMVKGLAKLSENMSQAMQGNKDVWVVVKNFDKMHSTGERDGDLLQ